ncbi:hypothetical protein MNV49_001616 [Pseudohyphozyma bogoriensis]|nr:hypothetical protein MNV49_001616 [Pseudohyphozyma bogoriensis]
MRTATRGPPAATYRPPGQQRAGGAAATRGSQPASSVISNASPTSIIVAIVILLSTGVLVRTLAPKYKDRVLKSAGALSSASANRTKKHKEVVKTIIQAQEAVAESHQALARGRKPSSASSQQRGAGSGGGGSATSSGATQGASAASGSGTTAGAPKVVETRSRSSSSAVASTSAAIVSGLQSLKGVALGVAPAAGPSSGGGASGSGATTPTELARVDTGVGMGGKKGKGKKGKAVAASPSSATTQLLAPPFGTPPPPGSPSSPSFVPTKRKVMKDSSTWCESSPAFTDHGVQTTYPFLTLLAAPAPAYSLNANDPFLVYPPLPPSRSPTPSPPSSSVLPSITTTSTTTTTTDAQVQTSPLLAPIPTRPPPVIFDLHASFQSTPPSRSPSQFRSPSPPPSPSPSNLNLTRRVSPTPLPHPPLSSSSSTPGVPTSTSRSRKQRTKAAAALVTNIVPGMARPARARQPSNDSETHLTSPSLRPGSLSRSSASEGMESVMGMDLLSRSIGKGKGRDPSSGTESSSDRSGVSGAMYDSTGSGVGRYIIPAPIPIPGRGLSSSTKVKDDEDYWKPDARPEELSWDSDIVGLGVVERKSGSERGDSEVRGKVREGKSWSEAAALSISGGSPANSPSVASAQLGVSVGGGAGADGVVGCFPNEGPPNPLLSPPTSPHPAHPTIAAHQALTNGGGHDARPWSPQQHASGGHHPAIPFPPSVAPQTPQHYPHSQGAGSLSRPSSRQSSLSVPSSQSQLQSQQLLQQQMQQLQQQQQAFAQYQAQYQHAIAYSLHAQAVNAQLQAQRHAAESRGGTPQGVNGGGPMPSPVYQTPQSLPHGPGWNSTPASPAGLNPPHLSQSVSPTSANFPQSSYGYYSPSPNGMYLSNGGNHLNGNYHLSSSQPPPSSGNHRASVSKRGGEGGKKSPRIGIERKMSSPGHLNARDMVPTDLNGWKAKVKAIEMEADRSGKELEIARWRLAVLEEERISTEIENQEALAALANRARRAEARLKSLEDARQQDSSSASASGSGSPATRPSSVMESSGSPTERTAIPLLEDSELARFAAPGVKVHPLTYLDLETVNFATLPAPHPRTNNLQNGGGRHRGRSPRLSAGDSRRRSNNQMGSNRRRSTHFDAPPPEEDDDDDVEIVLDSPVRQRPPRMPTRSSSLLDDEGLSADHHHEGRLLDDDEISNVDLDEDREWRPSREHSHSSYIGSLPTILKSPQPLPTIQSPLLDSPALVDRSNDSVLSIPSFVLDPASPSPIDETTPEFERLTSSTNETEDEAATPQPVHSPAAPALPPPISEEKTLLSA